MKPIEELLAELDEDQRAAVTAPLGKCLCVANAGSGKTRVLVYRIAYHIMHGVPESSFMMLTFTNKAAREMQERIRKILGREDLDIISGTFHSVAIRLLKKYGSVIGLNRKFTILGTDDAQDLLNFCRERYCADNEMDRRELPTARMISADYSLARSTCVSLGSLLTDSCKYLTNQVRHITAICREYEDEKKKSHRLDFDDILIAFNKLLDNDEFRNFIHGLYPNVFVDEYQDINRLQDEIIHKLNSGSLTAVGDPAQCIYGFRGSEVRYISDFRQDYAGADTHYIRNNYRSQNGIINVGLDVINASPENRTSPKVMIGTKKEHNLPVLKWARDELEQAWYIANEACAAHDRGIPYDEMAILLRTNRLHKAIELALTASSVPYSLACGIDFYSRLHIRAMMNFLKFIYNTRDQVSFWALFETAEGIGPKTSRRMFDAFANNDFNVNILETLKAPSKSRRDFNALTSSIRAAILKLAGGGETGELLKIFYEGYYKERMETHFGETNSNRAADIELLFKLADEFPVLSDFLTHSTLNTGVDVEDSRGKLVISTIHRSKGLEWDKVFLPFMNNDVLPGKSGNNDELLEEERRLLYVAITRARKELDFTCVQQTEMYREFSGDVCCFLRNLRPGRLAKSRAEAGGPGEKRLPPKPAWAPKSWGA